MSSAGGGGGGGGRVWPPRASKMKELYTQFKNGDIKCEKCNESATQNNKLKFYCHDHFLTTCHRCGDVFVPIGEGALYNGKATCVGCIYTLDEEEAWERIQHEIAESGESAAEMAHLEAQVEAHIEQVADSHGGRK